MRTEDKLPSFTVVFSSIDTTYYPIYRLSHSKLLNPGLGMYKHEVLGPFPSTEKKIPNLTSFHSSWSLLLLRSQATRERQGRASLECL